MKPAKTLLALSLIIALSACSSVKKELGVGRNSPDEFAVIKRAPLTLPPDYELRPPANPDEARMTEESAEKARTTLLGKTSEPAVKGNAENSLLAKMGSDSANPDIRKLINEDNGILALENRTVADKLIFWNDEEYSPSLEKAPSSVVDPAAEVARIRKNQAEGKPLNEGDVPVIEQKKGTIDKIF